jgi:hypothetical protein
LVIVSLPLGTIALNELFMEKSRIDDNDFETLMEDWFIYEEWRETKGRKRYPNLVY